ncbi:MAG TPA: L-2-hydroxyglutarate oxidase [Candidatus Angelobacter sp.]|nr:L-2-hydroxyglutarate oxidase [Candidatus Angelobacter sp.]
MGDVRVAVVGAGIVGLAVAREVTRRFPGAEVTVFDKEDHLAAHQTGHNSGVVHAGLYYQPGSLKAQLCRRGVPLLREFCAEHGIPFRELGKLVVALDGDELPALAEIERRARGNGVPDLVRLDAAAMREIEPDVAGVAALHSPHTAVVDYPSVCAALAGEVEKAGGRVLLSSTVTELRQETDGVRLVAAGQAHRVDQVIACAGLSGDAVTAMLGELDDLRILPFRGEYFRLRPERAALVRGLVYPVPDPRYPFLGVHLTRGVDDRVHVGPNAVLALSREGYRRRDVSLRDLREIATWPGSWRLAAAHWRSGVAEVAGSASRRVYAAHVRRYLPQVAVADLVPAPSGVRAQAVDRRGRLLDDFALLRAGRVLVVRNAPSPAATSSLAIAEHLVDIAFAGG